MWNCHSWPLDVSMGGKICWQICQLPFLTTRCQYQGGDLLADLGVDLPNLNSFTFHALLHRRSFCIICEWPKKQGRMYFAKLSPCLIKIRAQKELKVRLMVHIKLLEPWGYWYYNNFVFLVCKQNKEKEIPKRGKAGRWQHVLYSHVM